ncbi:efflux RND transporter periplasmic adaptor subunit [Aquimarina intermedia]|uniref:Cu(I)/Ag(I) efflux system membrane fusion protein n=1 Tax=Aquimarina intermedia TaxID=350814 RepID=A0A5S5CD37_9FLAO|nr:efflux RND transporter periplasmic adaptor subunit [Aquimarina intermedia]TYP77285.1 Cu(I)/Ag(I) efflux system membrane fusion protein [Aquimarina intermedia]
MDRKVLYIALAALAGLFAGYFIFGNNEVSTETSSMHDHDLESNEDQLWTCSMHPQIQQSEPGDCPICGMDLIPAETSSDGLSLDQFRLTKNAMALANIQTQKVGTSGSANNTLSLSGTIVKNEEKEVVQTAYYAGRLEKLYVNFEGETVKSGQLLAQIYAPELIAAQQELITMAALKKSQPDLYNAVRSKLVLWKFSNKQIDAIESSGVVQNTIPIYAKSSGIVISKMVEVGDYVKEGQPILKIADLSTVWAVFDVYESTIDQLKKGQNITIRTKTFPEEINTTISFIDPVLNSNTRVVAVRAVLPNKKDRLKPGMFVTGEVNVSGNDPKPEEIIIPKSAVLWTGKRSVVYVKTNPDEPVFEMRELKIKNNIGESYTISEGLSPADEIVVNGVFTIDASAQLQGKRSMMNSKEPQSHSMNESVMVIPSAVQKEFEEVILNYITLKDAFVVADAENIKEGASLLLVSTAKIERSAMDKMLSSHVFRIEKMAQAIFDNETIENQRDHFIALSEEIITIAKNMDTLNSTFYIMNCPMADSNKGADWLSKDGKIKNPYFGLEMLGCGSVIDTLFTK